jgi:hypothetical protein
VASLKQRINKNNFGHEPNAVFSDSQISTSGKLIDNIKIVQTHKPIMLIYRIYESFASFIK